MGAAHQASCYLILTFHPLQDSDKLQRTEKVADLPEGKDEKGLGLSDANASGGQSAGIKQGDNVGQGNKP